MCVCFLVSFVFVCLMYAFLGTIVRIGMLSIKQIIQFPVIETKLERLRVSIGMRSLAGFGMKKPKRPASINETPEDMNAISQ